MSVRSKYLPLWPVIFVDWHGVLSSDPFWISILKSPGHQVRRRLAESVKRLFDDNDDMVRRWMRGEFRAEEIVESMEVLLDKRCKPDFLVRRLIEDCTLMTSDAGFVRILREVKDLAFMVLATDNMDCFAESTERARRSGAGRRKVHKCDPEGSVPLVEVIRVFDDVLCSSDLGVLKRENPQSFFGEWLRQHSQTFERALLLDDVEANCAAFRSVGGTAIRVSRETIEKDLDGLLDEIGEWLRSRPKP